MQIQKVLKLRGPNIWANFSCLEVWIDLEEFKDTSSEMIPGFNERLMGWLPSMIEHRCSVGERGGFFERLRRGTVHGPHPGTRYARTAIAGRYASSVSAARDETTSKARTK